MGPTIWSVIKPAAIAGAASLAATIVAALGAFGFASAIGIGVSLQQWLALSAISIVATVLCIVLSTVVASRHGSDTSIDLRAAGAIETIALGFGVLAPLMTQAYVLLSRTKPDAIRDSILGAVLDAKFHEAAYDWYSVVILLILSFALVTCAVAAVNVRAKKKFATTVACAVAAAMLVINALFLQPWLPQSFELDATRAIPENLSWFMLAFFSVLTIFAFSLRAAVSSATQVTLVFIRGASRSALTILVTLGVSIVSFGLAALVATALLSVIALTVVGFNTFAGFLPELLSILGAGWAFLQILFVVGFLVFVGYFALVRAVRWAVRHHWVTAGTLLACAAIIVAINQARAPSSDEAENKGRRNAEQQTASPEHPLLERARLTCVAWNPFWSLFTTNRLSVDTASCRIEGADDAKFIVVIGSASRGPDQAEEERRALDRGFSLAKNVDSDAQVYVLNLGVVPMMDGQGERDAPFIPPIVSRQVMKSEDFEEALQKYLAVDADLPAHTQCTVYGFAPAANSASFTC